MPTPRPRPPAAALAALLAAAAGLALACSPAPPPEPAGDPNVVLVSIDTLRADHMSLYGYARPTTPNLEALAREAVVFEAFFNAGGGTPPSHASLFTSLYPQVHGVDRDTPLAGHETTLAELLHARGYKTAGFTDTVWLTSKFGFAQGFQTYDDRGGGLARILPRANRWLEQWREHGRGAPFFLFVHLFDVHSAADRLPYDSPEGFNERFTEGYAGDFDGCIEGRCASRLLIELNRRIDAGEIELSDALPPEDLEYVKGLYDGGVRYVDERLGQWFAALEHAGLWEDTLVVILSDHGEELGDHGRMLHSTHYEEFVRIPLVMKLPGARHGGTRVGALASMIDVMPTVLDVIGVDPPARLQGRSLLPAVRSGGPVRDEPVGVHEAVRSERWKLVPGRDALYDLESDPKEQRNLHAAHPEVVAELEAAWRELERRNEALRAGSDGPAPEAASLTEEERERLRALGYLADDPPH